MLVLPDDWSPQGVEDLEPGAWQALRETGRSVCVTAGAGAGKTEFLAQKATYLLQTSICPPPKRILAISFKRDAAQTLKARVGKRCPPNQARRFHSLTFDAFTKNMLDRFRAAIPHPLMPPANYEIGFPRRNDLEDFLTRHGRRDIGWQKMEKAIARAPLPFEAKGIPPPWRDLLNTYWQEQLERPAGALLSFAMINRLVDYLLRENPAIRRALQLTYPFVFLDEFQDTTYAQYDLVKTAFHGSDAVFTAVGDDKQRIMGWAGAMDNAFEEFAADFNAVNLALRFNWRSHDDLVAIQQVIAQQIDPNVEDVEARGLRAVDGHVAALWRFDTREQEAQQIAAWIANEVQKGMVEPHDCAILVRMRADDVEAELADVFAAQGLTIRNLARNVGEIAIQELLAEELTGIVLPLLRLGTGKRSPVAWNAAQEQLQALFAIDPSDERAQERLQRSIEEFSSALRAAMRENDPTGDSAAEMFRIVLEFFGADRLRQAFPAYRRQADFERVRTGFIALLSECTEAADAWCDALDRFEGIGQVPLMTIHKSKGLEFHTMIFFGLDAQTWWSLSPSREEELNSFFVAFTRAMQRAFFAYCRERGQAIAWLENMLLPAGLERVDGLAPHVAEAE
jgi:superfamily I DNA/RNA helicase